jgi:H+/gluconate symporter-like permease
MIFVRTTLFLLILFAMVYIGMYNTHGIHFYWDEKQSFVQPAALIFFAIFAIGVFAGTLFNMGGGKKGGSSKSKKD